MSTFCIYDYDIIIRKWFAILWRSVWNEKLNGKVQKNLSMVKNSELYWVRVFTILIKIMLNPIWFFK